MGDNIKASLNFKFVVPTDHVIASAEKLLESENQDERDVAKALLDVTKITKATQQGIVNRESVDLAPYFDHSMGDAVEAAERLKKSPDDQTRYVADSLISQAEAIVESRAMFLKETKRVKAAQAKKPKRRKKKGGDQ